DWTTETSIKDADNKADINTIYILAAQGTGSPKYDLGKFPNTATAKTFSLSATLEISDIKITGDEESIFQKTSSKTKTIINTTDSPNIIKNIKSSLGYSINIDIYNDLDSSSEKILATSNLVKFQGGKSTIHEVFKITDGKISTHEDQLERRINTEFTMEAKSDLNQELETVKKLNNKLNLNVSTKTDDSKHQSYLMKNLKGEPLTKIGIIKKAEGNKPPEKGYVISDAAKTLDRNQKIKVMAEMMRQLKCIHDEDLCHRDISGNNIIIYSNGGAQLFDFDTAIKQKPNAADPKIPVKNYNNKTTIEDKNTEYEDIGSPGYIPPEQLGENKQKGRKGDVYSMAISFALMLDPESILRILNSDIKELEKRTNETAAAAKKIFNDDTKTPPEIKEKLLSMLDTNPKNRPTSTDVHEFLNKYSPDLKESKNSAITPDPKPNERANTLKKQINKSKPTKISSSILIPTRKP
ncbi:protein kinase, partial [Gammaproteobacteria bacterium]|nr:protein kinase [Gammaproteobacteria bacterium]